MDRVRPAQDHQGYQAETGQEAPGGRIRWSPPQETGEAPHAFRSADLHGMEPGLRTRQTSRGRSLRVMRERGPNPGPSHPQALGSDSGRAESEGVVGGRDDRAETEDARSMPAVSR